MSDKTPEDLEYNRRVKRAIFESLFEVCETFYVQAMPHSELYMGERGLVGKEKEEGVVMVFGPYSARRLNWNESGIDCDMYFGRWQEVHIPWEAISRIFDKEGQFFVQSVFMDLPILKDAKKLSLEKSVSDKSSSKTKTNLTKRTISESKEETSTLIQETTNTSAEDKKKKVEESAEKIIEVDFTNRRKK